LDQEGIYFDLARLCRILMDFNPVENSPLFKTTKVNATSAAVALLQTNRANEEREDLSGLRMWEVRRYEIEKAEKVEALRRNLQL
jgi:hypothetical protein